MLQAGQILHERYQLQQKLGQNLGRQTWLAEDLAVQPTEVVIVKLLTFGGDVQWDDLKLFEREAHILQQLDHPRIPKYRHSFSIDDRALWFGLVQNYIPGTSLKQLVAQRQSFNEQQIRKIASDVLLILKYLHGLNPPVFHRDIKPSNLIWDQNEQIYLVDFGAVQNQAIAEGSTFTVVGTYGYAPIEQFGGRTVAASDLYALGATLIHLVTGTTPADLPQYNMRIQFAHLVTLKSDLITWLETLTEPALENRFKNASDALMALESGTLYPARGNMPVLQPTVSPNNSGQGGVFNSSVPVPEEILGWNWGAFLAPHFWPFTNRVWLGLLILIPYVGYVIPFILGAKGNEWAWKSRRWRSIEQFKAHQRGWAIAGLILGIPMTLMIWVLAFYLIFHYLR